MWPRGLQAPTCFWRLEDRVGSTASWYIWVGLFDFGKRPASTGPKVAFLLGQSCYA